MKDANLSDVSDFILSACLLLRIPARGRTERVPYRQSQVAVKTCRGSTRPFKSADASTRQEKTTSGPRATSSLRTLSNPTAA